MSEQRSLLQALGLSLMPSSDEIRIKEPKDLEGLLDLLRQVMLDPLVVETYARATAQQIIGLRFEITE